MITSLLSGILENFFLLVVYHYGFATYHIVLPQRLPLHLL